MSTRKAILPNNPHALYKTRLLPAILAAIIRDGGAERWVAHPILLWLTGFGGFLMNQSPSLVADRRASEPPATR